MRNTVRSMLICVAIAVIAPGKAAYAQQDLQIKNVEISPTPQGVSTPTITLQTNRSYRFTVIVAKTVALQQGASFVVRTECLRGGNRVTIGEARVGDSKGGQIYATYDVYPGEAGIGNCLVRTTVDAEDEIQESDERPSSNIWDRSAVFVR